MVSDHCSIGVGKMKGKESAQMKGEKSTESNGTSSAVRIMNENV
jgi:hypothetical protein